MVISHLDRDELPPLATAALLAGTAVRLSYGAGALLAPARMVEANLAPDTHGEADPRLLLRAFGGHQLLVGGFALVSARSRRHAGVGMTLSLLIDALDVASALLELRARGARDRSVLGGVALSGTGVLTFALALASLRRGGSGSGKAR